MAVETQDSTHARLGRVWPADWQACLALAATSRQEQRSVFHERSRLAMFAWVRGHFFFGVFAFFYFAGVLRASGSLRSILRFERGICGRPIRRELFGGALSFRFSLRANFSKYACFRCSAPSPT
jgi:hypothetical protein